MFNMLYMRSADGDRTMRAVIRDEALRLFAEHGPEAVSLRQVAAAAGASPALVVHHFGSREGLREVVDQHVVSTFEAMLGELSREADLYDPAATGSLVDAVLAHLPPGSPGPAYLRRLLLTDSEAGRRVFRALFDASKGLMTALTRAGLASPGADPDVRTAFLLANDLAVFLLRGHLADVLGFDPVSGEGMRRWAGEVLAVYSGGIGGRAEEPPSGTDGAGSRPEGGPR